MLVKLLPWRPTAVFTGRSKYKASEPPAGRGGAVVTHGGAASLRPGEPPAGSFAHVQPGPPSPPTPQVDPTSGLITYHRDTWDAVVNQSFPSLDGLALVLRQVGCPHNTHQPRRRHAAGGASECWCARAPRVGCSIRRGA